MRNLTWLRISKILAGLSIAAYAGSGCGLLGEKEAASRSLAQSGDACLDELGPLANQFLDGTVSETTWRATWDCVDDTIDLFKTFVIGSESAGYTPDDIRNLTQRFLFSKKTVTPAFVTGALSIKASIFGGTEKRLSKEELDNLRSLARFLKEETSALIPHLKNRKSNPTASNLRAFSLAIETFGSRLADYLNTGAHPTLTIDQAVGFTTELAKLSFQTDPKTVEAWTRMGLQIKTLLVRGDAAGIAGSDWTKILKYSTKAMGAFIAYLDAEGEDSTSFRVEMINKLQTVLNASIGDWGGALPFSEIEKLVDLAPTSILPELADDFRVGAKTLFHERVETVNGQTVRRRPPLARFFQTRTDTGIDAPAIERLVANYRLGMRSNGHLKAIYAGQKEEFSPAEFETRAKTYMANLDQTNKGEVSRLITIAKRYTGLHPAKTSEILFLDQDKHTANNLNRLSWYEIVGGFLLNAYGTTTTDQGKAATLDDMEGLIGDLKSLLYSFHMYHPNKTNIGAKRFREANLFMPNGNGDDKMDLLETTAYMAYIFSAANLNTRMIDLALEGSNPCPMKGWNVPLKVKIYEVQCFRDRFAANFSELFENMPRLKDELARMTPEERATWNQTLEYSAKLTGYNEDPITGFDVSSYAGLPHYAEAIMLRFDTNKDGSLDRRETLDNVFPIFKRELSIISKIKIDFVNKAVLLYLMQRGKQPEILDLLGWALSFDFLKSFNARRIRVYQIFAALSPPAPADEISQIPPPGIYPPPPGSVSSSSSSSLLGSTALGTITQGLVLGLTPVVTSSSYNSDFDLDSVDPAQFEGYDPNGPIIDPASPYHEALEVLPQDL